MRPVDNGIWNRRSFLKTAIIGTFLFLSEPAFSRELVGEKAPEGRLLLYNTNTGERLDVTYRDSSGEYDPEALSRIDNLLRCHHTQKMTRIDTGLIEFLNAVDKKLGGGNEIHIVSGFRSKEYNDLLRKQGQRAAKQSLHLFGKAIDLRIPGIKLSKIRKTALKMQAGGVGYYPKLGFIHLDTGRFRFW